MKKKVSLTDKGVEQVVITMADSLKIPYQKDKYLYSLELPENIGKGTVKAFAFENGLGVVDTDYVLQKSLDFHLGKGEVHPLKMVFNVGASFEHKLDKDQNFKTLNISETMLVASTPRNNHRFAIPSKSHISIFSIEINRKLFERRIESFLDDMDMEIEDLFRDLTGVLPFSYCSYYSYDIGRLIEEFRNNDLKGLTRNLYLEAKTYEILVLFLKQYMEDIRKPDKRKIFRENHLRAIRNSAEFIQNNLEQKVTVQQLAENQGVNVNILQSGFQTVYGMTVSEYIQHERLRKVKWLLENSDFSVSQIMYDVGLTSKSYLSKIFRESFGMTPSEFRQIVGGNTDATV